MIVFFHLRIVHIQQIVETDAHVGKLRWLGHGGDGKGGFGHGVVHRRSGTGQAVFKLGMEECEEVVLDHTIEDRSDLEDLATELSRCRALHYEVDDQSGDRPCK